MSQQQELSIPNQDGVVTNFSILSIPQALTELTEEQKLARANKFKIARDPEKKGEDIAPYYWEARKGEEKELEFNGYRIVNKKDEAGNTIGQDFVVLFAEENGREVVMGQVVIKDASRNMVLGNVYTIKCTDSSPRKAKMFEIIHK